MHPFTSSDEYWRRRLPFFTASWSYQYLVLGLAGHTNVRLDQARHLSSFALAVIKYQVLGLIGHILILPMYDSYYLYMCAWTRFARYMRQVNQARQNSYFCPGGSYS